MVTKITQGRGGLSVSQTEMSVDATISLLGATGTRRYSGISGAGGTTVKTAHLIGDRPVGGNVCFLDNHVQWRKYSSMTNKISPRGLPPVRVLNVPRQVCEAKEAFVCKWHPRDRGGWEGLHWQE